MGQSVWRRPPEDSASSFASASQSWWSLKRTCRRSTDQPSETLSLEGLLDDRSDEEADVQFSLDVKLPVDVILSIVDEKNY